MLTQKFLLVASRIPVLANMFLPFMIWDTKATRKRSW